MQPIISYIRVSTGKQAKSGLGIEAQREDPCPRLEPAQDCVNGLGAK
jgi:hypothetical protein